MNGVEMPSKLKTNKVILQVLGWWDIVVGIIVGVVFVIMGMGMRVSGGEEMVVAGSISFITGLIAVIFCVAVGILMLITAKGVAERKNWAKIAGIVLAILSLASFPIGTALGVWMLINFFSEESQQWFSS